MSVVRINNDFKQIILREKKREREREREREFTVEKGIYNSQDN